MALARLHLIVLFFQVWGSEFFHFCQTVGLSVANFKSDFFFLFDINVSIYVRHFSKILRINFSFSGFSIDGFFFSPLVVFVHLFCFWDGNFKIFIHVALSPIPLSSGLSSVSLIPFSALFFSFCFLLYQLPSFKFMIQIFFPFG